MRLLIVEDEHKIANSIKKGFEQEGYAADVTYDGEDGLDMASSVEYDCIILDLMLPSMTGEEICKKLREDKNHTPILMLTAKGDLASRVEGLNIGADDYLVKPFAFSELVARVRALTRRPKKLLDPVLKVDDLSLNVNSYEVKRNNIELNLSRKEFGLLEYLMRHPNQILPKEKIIEHVWNYDADILPNTVEVYVGYLRQKIDKNFKKSKPLIHTVRGFGYKIGVAK